MVVDISKIAKIYGASVDVDYREEINDLDVNGRKIDFSGPVSIKGKITNLKELYLFEASIKGTISVECDRCTKGITYDFDISAEEKFTQSNTENEDDVYLFKGDTIDLIDVVKDIIVLNIPMKFVCSEECKGLCPECGSDLNKNDCGCKNDYIDPRLEGLKKLLK